MRNCGVKMKFDLSFFSGKNVLVTGHIGFKGPWLCRLLTLAGQMLRGMLLRHRQSHRFLMKFISLNQLAIRQTLHINNPREYHHSFLYQSF